MKIWIPECVIAAIERRAQRMPYTPIEHKGDAYMRRNWLIVPPGHGVDSDHRDHGKTGIGARVHYTLRSDRGRDHHCHPWWNISIVLRGGYWEIMPLRQSQLPWMDSFAFRRVWRGPGSIVFRRATDRHTLEIPEGQMSVSLFVTGPWKRDWGFHTPDGWVYWRDYNLNP